MNKFQSAASILDQLVQEGKIPGACLIVNEGNETILNHATGWQDVEKTRLVTENTLYRLASMTKPIATVAALTLMEEGKLDLDASIAEYLPEYRGTDKEPVKVVHLMNHSCGLGMLMHPGMVQAMMLSDVLNDKLADRVARWSALVPDFPAGTATGYSPSVGFEILGRIIEVVSGMELDAFLRDRLFAPLQMNDTGFILNEEQKARLSVLYHDPAAPVVPTPGDFKMEDYVDPSFAGYFSAGAGLNGTAHDYDRFVRMLYNGGELDGARILKPETVKRMSTPSNDLPARPGVKWGLGVQVFGRPEETGFPVSAGSYSWSGAYGTHFFIDPAANRSFVLMLNCDNLGGSESYISRLIEKAIYAAE